MRNEVMIIQKRSGETPLAALTRLRKEKPDLAKEKLSYAGRLDPLAEGEMLVLVGEACKHRSQYLDLDKTYEVDILCGVSTDTHDVLGLATNTSEKKVTQADMEGILQTFVGLQRQMYPMYSSKTLDGKALFAHARSGRDIKDSRRPYKDVTIYSIHTKKCYTLSVKKLQTIIKEKINSVIGDFRQKEILARWEEYFAKNPVDTYMVCSVEVHCSSGTYMRTLADEVGKKIGTEALALHIKRTKVHV